MSVFRKSLWVLLVSALLIAAPLSLVLANETQPDVPPGFYPVSSAPGIQLYQKDYSPGSPDYVQVIDLSQGAAVKLLHGPIREPRPDKGVYGGADPRMGYNTIQKFWEWFSQGNETAFCVTNGQFFYMKENPTRLAFPLKKDGVVVTDGFANEQYPGEKLLFEIWEDHVDIVELTRGSLYNSDAPDIIAGLTPQANKRAKHYTGRTFVGIDDRDQDARFETVLVFNTKSARQVDADEVLTSFGADKVMMLDGGGSTQLVCQGELLIESGRFIPQAVGIMAGEQPPIQPDNPTEPKSGWTSPQNGVVPEPTNPTGPAGERLQNNIPQESGLVVISDVLWIPVLILPMAGLALFIAARVRG